MSVLAKLRTFNCNIKHNFKKRMNYAPLDGAGASKPIRNCVHHPRGGATIVLRHTQWNLTHLFRLLRQN